MFDFILAVKIALTLAFVLAFTGCFGETQVAARQRFALETGCHVDRVRTQALGSGDYRVGGCGQRRTYHCRLAQGWEALEDTSFCHRTE